MTRTLLCEALSCGIIVGAVVAVALRLLLLR